MMKIEAKKSFKIGPEMAVLAIFGFFKAIFQTSFKASLDTRISNFLLWWDSTRCIGTAQIGLVRQSLESGEQWKGKNGQFT